MRLTCPNCAAQYEVPPEAIPPQGRDVQCSACGQTWFEQPADSRPQLMDGPGEGGPRVEGDPEEADDLAEIEAAPPPPPPPPAGTPAAEPPAATPPPPPVAAATPLGEEPAAPPGPDRQRVPPEVERILREEAQHEARVRAEEAARRAAAESEPAPVPVIERPAGARPRSEVIEATTVAAPSAAPVAEEPPPVVRPIRPARHVDREIDLDRINSTLRSQADRIGAVAPQIEAPSRRRGDGGFGGGFWGALLAIAILALIYVYHGQIIQAVPPTAAVLNPYAQAVESGRNWLDRQVGRVLGAEAQAE